MIKKFEQYNELDPYGEEDWDEKEEFHVGDIVICINDLGGKRHLKKGVNYKVLDIRFLGGYQYLHLMGIGDWWDSGLFKKEYF